MNLPLHYRMKLLIVFFLMIILIPSSSIAYNISEDTYISTLTVGVSEDTYISTLTVGVSEEKDSEEKDEKQSNLYLYHKLHNLFLLIDYLKLMLNRM